MLKGIFDIEYTNIGNHAILVNDKYFKGLPDLLEKTPIKTVINYMLWTVFKSVTYALSDKYQNRMFQYSSSKTGQKVIITNTIN